LKNSILIISFLFFVSCFKGTKEINIVKSPHFDHPQKDTINSVFSDSLLVNSTNVIEPDHIEMSNIVVESSNYLSGSAMNFAHGKDLKIVYVKNTKVVANIIDLSEGRVVYKIPEKMKIRSTYKVLVRISKSKSVVSIYDSLSKKIMTSTLPVTQTMEVKLVDISPADRKCFEITEGNNAVQIVDEGDTYTEWSWNVTPIKVGNSKLKIVISIIRDGNKKDIVYEDSVEVEKDIQIQIKFFFESYWQWMLSTLIIPFAVWFYKNRKEKKEGKKSPKRKNKNGK
jgi:hypothetical protein